MKNTIFFPVILLAVFACMGCQTGPNTTANSATTNTAANSTPPVNNSKTTATPKAAEALPASSLKPEDISLDKPVPAEELRNAVFANEEAWQGKEVAVSGDYNGHSTSKLQSGDKYSINVQSAAGDVVINCNGRKAPPADVKERRDGRVFRGTVASINKSFRQVTLEPCEIVQ